LSASGPVQTPRAALRLAVASSFGVGFPAGEDEFALSMPTPGQHSRLAARALAHPGLARHAAPWETAVAADLLRRWLRKPHQPSETADVSCRAPPDGELAPTSTQAQPPRRLCSGLSGGRRSDRAASPTTLRQGNQVVTGLGSATCGSPRRLPSACPESHDSRRSRLARWSRACPLLAPYRSRHLSLPRQRSGGCRELSLHKGSVTTFGGRERCALPTSATDVQLCTRVCCSIPVARPPPTRPCDPMGSDDGPNTLANTNSRSWGCWYLSPGGVSLDGEPPASESSPQHWAAAGKKPEDAPGWS